MVLNVYIYTMYPIENEYKLLIKTLFFSFLGSLKNQTVANITARINKYLAPKIKMWSTNVM